MRRGRSTYNPRWETASLGRNPRVPTALVDLLASLRAAFMTYRNAHWQVGGKGYYANHLLLQRIYEDATKHTDTMAEKMVGFFGPGAVETSGRQLDEMSGLITSFEELNDHPLERSLAATEHVRKSLDKAYEALESKGILTLGWEDTLSAIASDKDEHIYLLQQVLDGNEVKLVPRMNPTALKRRLTRA